MQMFFVIAVIALIFLVIFQIAKAAEYVSVLKGEVQSRRQTNKVNGFLMLAFMIFGLIGVWYCNEILAPKTLMPAGAASYQGEKVDSMLITTLVTMDSFLQGNPIVNETIHSLNHPQLPKPCL